MSAEAGPNIVYNGLVLCLDVANTRSYPGTGESWNDLSVNRNNVTINGSPIYSSANNGYFTFDAVNDYVNFFAPSLTTTATIEMWVKLKTNYGNKMFMGWNLYDIYTAGNHIGFNTASSDLYGITSTTVSNLNIIDNWAHYIFEMRSDVSYTNNKIYINKVQQSLSQILGTESTTNRSFSNGDGRIGAWRSAVNYLMNYDLGLFNIYNRSLTQSEINQNYDALKGRYGL